MSEVNAFDVVDQKVYNDVVGAIETIVDGYVEKDPEGKEGLSVYLTLRIICAAMEQDLGIEPVAVTLPA